MLLPSGVVTFLMTDVEGSTPAWERDAEGMLEAITAHDAIVAAAVEQHRGVLLRERGEGDSWFAVFQEARDAVACAAQVQTTLAKTSPLRVRIGIHTADVQLVRGSYYGPEVNRCARIRSAGHGGQVLLSAACANAAGVDVRDLGEHRLRGFSEPERLLQLEVSGLPSEFPPVVTADSVERARPSFTVNVADHAPPGSVGVEVLPESDDGEFTLIVSCDEIVVERFDRITLGGPRDAVRIVNEQSLYVRLAYA